MYYELYSLQESKSGEWRFSLLYNTDRNKTVREVFNKTTLIKGLDQLRQKMSQLPRGSHIVWLDRLTFNGARVKGSESLKYPPDQVVADVKQEAQTHGIEVVGPPMAANAR